MHFPNTFLAVLISAILIGPTVSAGSIVTVAECSATQFDSSQLTVTDPSDCAVAGPVADATASVATTVSLVDNTITTVIQMSADPFANFRDVTFFPWSNQATATSQVQLQGTTPGLDRMGLVQFWFNGFGDGVGAVMRSTIALDIGQDWDFEYDITTGSSTECTNPFDVPFFGAGLPCTGLLPVNLGGSWSLGLNTSVSTALDQGGGGNVWGPSEKTISFRLFEIDGTTPVDFLLAGDDPDAIPEPASGVLVLVGLVALGAASRRRKASH